MARNRPPVQVAAQQDWFGTDAVLT